MSLAAAACLVPNIGRCGGYRMHMIAILHLDGDKTQPRSRRSHTSRKGHHSPEVPELQHANMHHHVSPDPTISSMAKTGQLGSPGPCVLHSNSRFSNLTHRWPALANGDDPGNSIKPPPDFVNQALVRVCDCIGSVLRAKPTAASLVLDGARSQTVSGHHDSPSSCDLELSSECYNIITARQDIIMHMHGLDGRKQFLIGQNWHSVWVGS
jgi:hypothetical protein